MAIIKPEQITIYPYDTSTDDISEETIIIPVCSNGGSVCTTDITKNWGEYEDIEDLKKAINELFIRFNTSPKVYTKHDYLLLLQLLYRGFIFGFDHPIDLGDNISDIATVDGKVFDFKHPLAKKGSQVSEELEDETIPTVGYVDTFKLQWEEF